MIRTEILFFSLLILSCTNPSDKVLDEIRNEPRFELCNWMEESTPFDYPVSPTSKNQDIQVSEFKPIKRLPEGMDVQLILTLQSEFKERAELRNIESNINQYCVQYFPFQKENGEYTQTI